MIDADAGALPATANSFPRPDRRLALEKAYRVSGRIARRIDGERAQVPAGDLHPNSARVELAQQQRAKRRTVEHRRGSRRAAAADQHGREPAHAVARNGRQIRLVDVPHLDVAPETQQPCKAAPKIVRVGSKQRCNDGPGRRAADYPERRDRPPPQHSRDRAEHADLIRSTGAAAGKDDRRVIWQPRHAFGSRSSRKVRSRIISIAAVAPQM